MDLNRQETIKWTKIEKKGQNGHKSTEYYKCTLNHCLEQNGRKLNGWKNGHKLAKMMKLNIKDKMNIN